MKECKSAGQFCSNKNKPETNSKALLISFFREREERHRDAIDSDTMQTIKDLA